MKEFGYNLGIAFQLKDDVLDLTSYNDVLGKHVGTDLKEGKLTLPLIHALKNAKESERAYLEKIITKGRITQRDFERVRGIIEKTGGIAYTMEATERYLGTAKQHLESFPPSQFREALLELADYMLKREM